MNKSGSRNYLASFPYAKEMAELLDSRPISIEEGIDSSVLENSNNSTDEDMLNISFNARNGMNFYIVFSYIFSNKYN